MHRAINDRIQDEMDQVYIQEPSKESVRSSMPEDFPFDKPRKKFVGGGGVISKYENPFRYRLLLISSITKSKLRSFKKYLMPKLLNSQSMFWKSNFILGMPNLFGRGSQGEIQ